MAHKADGLPLAITTTGKRKFVFEANFHLPDEKTLEILLFADEAGRLGYVEIDCVGNNFPVPDNVEIIGEPFGIYISDQC